MRDWPEMSVEAAKEVMGYFGEKIAAEVQALFPMIRVRASSRVRVGASALRDGIGGLEAAHVRPQGPDPEIRQVFCPG